MEPPSTSDDWSRVWDQTSQSYYYWNTITYEVDWSTPPGFDPAVAAKRERDAAGLSISDVPEGLALLLATRKIQAVFRSRQARKALHSWSHVYDPNEGKYYYWNTMTYEVSWEPPPGYSQADANKRERDAAGLGIEQLPHGLGLLVATRKIQGLWRKRQARKKSRLFAAEKAAEEGGYSRSIWIRMDDPQSGFPYWYHRDTHEVTWDDPYPKPIGNRYKDHDTTIFYPERVVFCLLSSYLETSIVAVLSKNLVDAVPLSFRVMRWTKKCIQFGPLLSCGSLMAMRIRGHEECEAIANVLNALRIMSGAMNPTPHLQNKIERFKLNEKLLLYRGNRRWLQKHRSGLLGNMSDVVWLADALGRVEEIKKCLANPLHTLGELRDVNEDAAYLFEYLRCVVGVEEKEKEEVVEVVEEGEEGKEGKEGEEGDKREEKEVVELDNADGVKEEGNEEEKVRVEEEAEGVASQEEEEGETPEVDEVEM